MKSRMAAAVKMRLAPVAVLFTDEKPAGATQFRPGVWGCVVAMLNAAAHGRTVVFDEDTCGCMGGAAGLGFKRYELGFIEYFLSTGGADGREGEFYKKCPAYAAAFIRDFPAFKTPSRYVVMKPLQEVATGETPVVVVFLVNPDQLSALVTLANFDRPTKDNATVYFGAGCHSTVIEPVCQGLEAEPKALIGLTDLSARKYVSPELLSFSLPFARFLEMEEQVDESFLVKHTWLELSRRLPE